LDECGVGVTRLCGWDGCGDCGGDFLAGTCEGEASAGMSSSRPMKDRR